MRNLILQLSVYAVILLTLASCKKENSSPNAKKDGDISVSINYKPSSTPGFVHSWGQTEIRLHQDGALVSTKFANPNNANIEFGAYPYGNYRIDCIGAMTSTNVNSGNSSNKTITRTENFVLDKKNKSVSISMSY